MIAHSIVYVLSVAEGRTRNVGRFRNYVNDVSLTDSSFKAICRGPNIFFAEINDLTPNTCYHFRLSVEFMGSVVDSPVVAVPTSHSVPCAPTKPRASFTNRVCAFAADGKEPRVHVQWYAPEDNGDKVVKYQLQIREIQVTAMVALARLEALSLVSAPLSAAAISSSASAASVSAAGNSTASPPSPSSPSTDKFRAMVATTSSAKDEEVKRGKRRGGGGGGEDKMVTAATDMDTVSVLVALNESTVSELEEGDVPPGFDATSWQTVYTNKDIEAIVGGPAASTVMWFLRVKAANAAGWSSSSPALMMSYKTHPSLFPAGFALMKINSLKK